jgi:hypothetical protein
MGSNGSLVGAACKGLRDAADCCAGDSTISGCEIKPTIFPDQVGGIHDQASSMRQGAEDTLRQFSENARICNDRMNMLDDCNKSDPMVRVAIDNYRSAAAALGRCMDSQRPELSRAQFESGTIERKTSSDDGS